MALFSSVYLISKQKKHTTSLVDALSIICLPFLPVPVVPTPEQG
jgi:hypothetical protein